MIKKVLFIFVFVFIFNCFNTIVYSADKNKFYLYVTSSMYKYTKGAIEEFNKKNKDNINVIIITGSSGELINKALITKLCDLMILASSDFVYLAEDKGLLKDSISFIKQIPVIGLNNKIALEKDNIIAEDLLFRDNLVMSVGNQESTAIGKKYKLIKEKIEKSGRKLNFKRTIPTIAVSQTVNYLKANIVDIGIIFNTTAKSTKTQYVDFPKKYIITDSSYIVIPKYTKYDKESKNLINFLFEKFKSDMI